MKLKHLACMAALFFAAFGAAADIVYPVDRADRDYNTTATEKLDRGLNNLILFPLEIPNTIFYNSARYHNQGFIKGLADGTRNAGVRLGQGLFDTLTFPWNTGNFNVPWDPEPNTVHPEWIPFVNYTLPWVDLPDSSHDYIIDGGESQFEP